MGKPLEKYRVIDLSKILAGPLCGQMLADYGAEVIKIESPAGDDNRRWAPLSPSGESCNFMAVNRGKRSLTLNLKAPGGYSLLMDLLAESDVLIHCFLPSVAERLHLTFDELHEKFPRLIVCSISGYGAKGDMRDRPGYDAVIAAFSGIMAMTGEAGRIPVRSGVSAIDLTTGILAYSGILTALCIREQDGIGRHVRGSLLETAVSLLNFNAIGWLQAGSLPERAGSGIKHLVPYQIFECKDKGLIYIAAHSDGVWSEFCGAIARPDLLENTDFSSSIGRARHREVLVPLLEAEFRRRTYAEWEAVFDKTSIPFSPVNGMDAALEHPQVMANDMVVGSQQSDGSTDRFLGLPFKVGDLVQPSMAPPPRLGEHTESLLKALLKLDPQKIALLRQQGVI